MTVDYNARLKRVYAAIHENPAQEHSLDELAAVAALSRFHFHRVFAAMTGETVAEAVRRVRLNRAAHALARSDTAVAAVGRACGYPNAASFTRAFRAAYGVTPDEFRKAGQALPLKLRAIGQGGHSMFPVSITTEAPRRAIGLPHTGPYMQIGAAYDQLSAELAALNLWDQTRGLVGVYFDDPSIVAPQALRSFAGVIVDADLPLPAALTELTIAGGRYARLAFTGPYTGFGLAYEWLYGDWLAGSGEAMRDAPSWELYLNTPMNTAPEDLRTDILLPLEDRA